MIGVLPRERIEKQTVVPDLYWRPMMKGVVLSAKRASMFYLRYVTDQSAQCFISGADASYT